MRQIGLRKTRALSPTTYLQTCSLVPPHGPAEVGFTWPDIVQHAVTELESSRVVQTEPSDFTLGLPFSSCPGPPSRLPSRGPHLRSLSLPHGKGRKHMENFKMMSTLVNRLDTR
jgi:hypothetical protein